MQAYDDYLNGRLPELEFDPAEEKEALAALPEAIPPSPEPAAQVS